MGFAKYFRDICVFYLLYMFSCRASVLLISANQKRTGVSKSKSQVSDVYREEYHNMNTSVVRENGHWHYRWVCSRTFYRAFLNLAHGGPMAIVVASLQTAFADSVLQDKMSCTETNTEVWNTCVWVLTMLNAIGKVIEHTFARKPARHIQGKDRVIRNRRKCVWENTAAIAYDAVWSVPSRRINTGCSHRFAKRIRRGPF